MAELRCPHTMHGILDEGTIEIACDNSRCGKRSGVVVLHKFDLVTGDLVSTKIFSDPIRASKGGETNGTASLRTPVRHP